MALTKHAVAVTQFLTANGFEYLRTNSRGAEVWRRDDLTTSLAFGTMTESQARHYIENMSRKIGVTPIKAARKRNGSASKQRRVERGRREAAAAQRAKEQHQQRVAAKEDELAKKRAERQQLIDQAVADREARERELGGLSKNLTRDETSRVVNLLEAKAEKDAEWLRLSQATPLANTARHRS